MKKNKENSRFTVKKLVFAAAALALGVICSLIKLIHMPMGGSVTLLSMFFISVIGYWFGPYVGLISAFVYGAIQFVANPYIVSFLQVMCDYFCAFTALGLSGFFWKKKFGLQIGYVVSVLGRYLFTFLSGWIFFGEYAPETFSGAWIYSLAYNGAYLGAECAITLVIICIPPVSKALAYVKKLATYH